ncbi:sigma-70 family RNA polymerase sigma factor [candidate division KSB1 bacterium]|nr:sigma-70 family RNA polymerase sigma factor [candidate division KSB1 bacterium]
MKLFRQTQTSKTDEELMRAIQSGETRAFEMLYNRYSERLLNYFFRMLGNNNSIAHDLLQELFLKIINKPHFFNADKRFVTWIYAIASNMCKNEYRRRDIRAIESPLPASETQLDSSLSIKKPDELFEQKSFSEAVFAKLATLDEEKQNTFILRFQQQLSIKEISEVLDCPQGTVKSRLFYTIRFLAAELHDYNPNER